MSLGGSFRTSTRGGPVGKGDKGADLKGEAGVVGSVLHSGRKRTSEPATCRERRRNYPRRRIRSKKSLTGGEISGNVQKITAPSSRTGGDSNRRIWEATLSARPRKPSSYLKRRTGVNSQRGTISSPSSERTLQDRTTSSQVNSSARGRQVPRAGRGNGFDRLDH